MEIAEKDVTRFWAGVRPSGNGDGCMVWTRALDRDGYGQTSAGGRRGLRAHRVSFEMAYGPVPDGLVLDHLCRNSACVNPEHLEAVTQQVNTLRGLGPGAVNAKKTCCLRGHPLHGTNLYVCPRGRRECRTCRRSASAACRKGKYVG